MEGSLTLKGAASDWLAFDVRGDNISYFLIYT